MSYFQHHVSSAATSAPRRNLLRSHGAVELQTYARTASAPWA